MILKTLILGVAFVFLEISTSNSLILNNETTIVTSSVTSVYNETPSSLQYETSTSSISTSQEENFQMPESCSAFKVVNYFTTFPVTSHS